MACVALPTCGLALAESERYLPDLVTQLEAEVEAAGLRDDAIVIRMTGCPNGCGRPYLAEIGFVGKAPGKYNMYLGAAFNGSRLNTLYKPSVAGGRHRRPRAAPAAPLRDREAAGRALRGLRDPGWDRAPLPGSPRTSTTSRLSASSSEL